MATEAMTLEKLNRLVGHEELIAESIRKRRRQLEVIEHHRKQQVPMLVSFDDRTGQDLPLVALNDLNDLMSEVIAPVASDLYRVAEFKLRAEIREFEIRIELVRATVARWFYDGSAETKAVLA